MTTLREKLARKRAHSTSLTFPIGDDGEAARVEMDKAEQALDLAQNPLVKPTSAAINAARRRLDKARADYADKSVTIQFRGLTEEERDALTAAHPATAAQQEEDKEKPPEDRREIDQAAFLPAALAVCALDSDLSEADWKDELASERWTAGEKQALFRAVVNATNQEPAPGLGKG